MRRHRFVALGALWGVVLLCSIACAQSATSNLGHQAWSTENGLPQNSVHQIFQTQDGYIWIATEGGVARFNGVDFTVFNREDTPGFTSDDICCFAEDSNHALWIGTSDGLLKYSGGVFRHFSVTDGLPSAAVVSLVIADDGALVVLTDNGAVGESGGKFSPIETQTAGAISAMGRGEDGSIWFASSAGLFKYENRQLRSVAVGLALPRGEKYLGSRNFRITDWVCGRGIA